MTHGIRGSFHSVGIWAGMAIAVIGGMRLVNFSPALPGQIAPIAKQVVSVLPGVAKPAAGPSASRANQWVAN